MEISIVPYEMIQYIQGYETTKDAANAVNTKTEFASLSSDEKQVILDIISRKTL